MGIRFTCKHCQKRLNVKSAQSGQTGQCPRCGNSIAVPSESEISWIDADGKTEIMDSQSIFDVDNQITQAGLSASIQLESDRKLEEFSNPYVAPVTSSRTLKRPSKFGSSDPFLLDKPKPPSNMGKVDPIAEAPRKIWYFRSKKIGEKGPLKARFMQEHLEKGDVTIGCIVWREDWEDWQPAERVFPTLLAEVERRKANRVFDDSHCGISDEWNPHSALQRRRRKMQLLGIVAIAAGLLTIGALATLLIKLVSN